MNDGRPSNAWDEREASLGKCMQTIVKLFTRKTILALKIHNKYGERDECFDCVSLSTSSL